MMWFSSGKVTIAIPGGVSVLGKQNTLFFIQYDSTVAL